MIGLTFHKDTANTVYEVTEFSNTLIIRSISGREISK